MMSSVQTTTRACSEIAESANASMAPHDPAITTAARGPRSSGERVQISNASGASAMGR